MTYLISALIISALIAIHEFGHLLAARAVGIPVRRFSLGFGRRLCGVRIGQTDYQISLIPLGGYVMMGVDDEKEYHRISLWRRITMSLGGPAANLLLPMAMFALGNLCDGRISASALLIEPAIRCATIVGAMLAAIGGLLAGHGDVSGVVGIVAIGGKMITGLAAASLFTSLISLNLAIVNLLPLPPLDGGKIVLDTLTSIRPRWAMAYVPLCLAGWAAMAVLMIYATVLDVSKCLTA